jgi:hypothetical protein
MKKLTSVAGAGLTALALGFALVGCGSDAPDEEATSTETSAETSSEASTSSAAAPTTAPAPEGAHETIQDYVQQNRIQETAVKRGDPGPKVDVPIPPGWAPKDDVPNTYGALIYPNSSVPNNPPRVLTLMSKLTGDVDPEKILEYAPGELQNMPGWVPMNPGERGELSGFDAVQVAGAYSVDGKSGLIAQKTVVIPADDGVYVLQFNAYSSESEAPALAEATQIINDQTTITP